MVLMIYVHRQLSTQPISLHLRCFAWRWNIVTICENVRRASKIFPRNVQRSTGLFISPTVQTATDLLPLSHISEIVLTDVIVKLIRIENNEALVSLRGIEHLLQDEFHGDVTIRQNRQLASFLSFLKSSHNSRRRHTRGQHETS